MTSIKSAIYIKPIPQAKHDTSPASNLQLPASSPQNAYPSTSIALLLLPEAPEAPVERAWIAFLKLFREGLGKAHRRASNSAKAEVSSKPLAISLFTSPQITLRRQNADLAVEDVLHLWPHLLYNSSTAGKPPMPCLHSHQTSGTFLTSFS